MIKVAIMCFGLPPNGAVGGRRWTLFINELIERGVEVYPITSEEIGYAVSSWQSMYPENLKQLKLPFSYPKILMTRPSTVYKKIEYRLGLRRVKNKCKGNIYDPTAFYDDHVKTIVKFLRDNRVGNLVVSGAPFHYFHTASLVKKIMPEINLILEYRDIWTDSNYEYGEGIKLQSKERYAYESKCENASIRSANAIVAVSKDVKTRISHRFIKNSNVHIIPNGYVHTNNEKSKSKLLGDNLDIIYAGSVNSERDYYMKFLNAFHKFKDEQIREYSKIRIRVYNNSNPKFQDDAESLGLDIFEFLPAISQKEMDIELANADYSLILKRKGELVNSFPSKFFDSIKLGVPLICYSPKGDVTEFIQNKNLGLVLDETLLDNFTATIRELHRNKHSYDVIEKENEFEIKSLTSKYIDLFQ